MKEQLKRTIMLILVTAMLVSHFGLARSYAEEETGSGEPAVAETAEETVEEEAPAEEEQEEEPAVKASDTRAAIAQEGDANTIHWTLYDDGSLVIAPQSGSSGTLPDSGYLNGNVDNNYYANSLPWLRYRTSIRSVSFEATVKTTANMSGLFYGCTNLETVDFTNLDVSSAIYADQVFHSCSKLSTADLSPLAFTGKLETAQQMFINSGVKTVALGNCFVNANMNNATGMFSGCRELTAVTGFSMRFNPNKTTNVVNDMFLNCKKLESIDLLNWTNTSSINRFHQMFMNCESLESIDLSGITNADGVNTSFRSMFSGCTKLETLDISGLSDKNIKANNTKDMFAGCSKLSEVWFGDSFQFINALLPDPSGDDYTGNWIRWSDAGGTVVCDNPDTATAIKNTYSNKNYIPAGTWIWEKYVTVTYTNDGDEATEYVVAVNGTDIKTETLAAGATGTVKVPMYGGLTIIQKYYQPDPEQVVTTITYTPEIDDYTETEHEENAGYGGWYYLEYEMNPIDIDVIFTNVRENVTVNFVDGHTGSAYGDPVMATYGKEFELSVEGLDPDVHGNMDFVGWSTDPDAQEAEFADGDSVVLDTQNLPDMSQTGSMYEVTFYAVFVEYSYECVEGDGQTWTRGSTSDLIFKFERSRNDDERTYPMFEEADAIVEIDGEIITEYTAEPGSLIVTLPASYLQTLATGQHTITTYFNDYATGTGLLPVEARFYIREKSVDPEPYVIPKTGIE